MKTYPQYDWEKVLEAPSLVLLKLYAEIPDVKHQRSWAFVQLQTFMANMMGGKAKKKDDQEPIDPFMPQEFQAAFLPPPLEDMPAPLLEPQHCWALMRAVEEKQVPSWVLQVVGLHDQLERVDAVAVRFDELLKGTGS